jgi:hypothetical protein
MLATLSSTGQTMAPANASGVGDYADKAKAAATIGPAPGSIFEGMQTIADLSRTRAHYNPLDPEKTGNKQHFLAFSQNIADAPMLSLLRADTVSIEEKSQDASKLINGFVSLFDGLSKEDVAGVTAAVTKLADAALSYSDKIEKYSQFAQNLLQTDSSGNVKFHLYSSTFQIHTTESKGVITFQSSYELLRAVYQLSPSSWQDVKDIFSQQKKADAAAWFDSMTTKPKAGSGIRALCLQ